MVVFCHSYRASLRHEKPLAPFERKAQEGVVPKRSDWKRCKKSITSPPRATPCESITSFLLPASVRFPVLFCQKRNDARQYGIVSFSSLSSISFCSDKHPKGQMDFTLLMTTYKNCGCLHLPVRCSGLPQPFGINRQRNTHVGVYSTPVKCASEDMVSPRSTLRRVYATPRGVTPAMFLIPDRLW